MSVFDNIYLQFWVCPFKDHRERRGVVTVVWDGPEAFCTVPSCIHSLQNREVRQLYKREMWDCFLASQHGAASRREAELFELFGREDIALKWWLLAASQGDEDARQYVQFILFEQGEGEYGE